MTRPKLLHEASAVGIILANGSAAPGQAAATTTPIKTGYGPIDGLPTSDFPSQL